MLGYDSLSIYWPAGSGDYTAERIAGQNCTPTLHVSAARRPTALIDAVTTERHGCRYNKCERAKGGAVRRR